MSIKENLKNDAKEDSRYYSFRLTRYEGKLRHVRIGLIALPSTDSILNICSILVNIKKSSCLATRSPMQIRFPIINVDFYIKVYLTTFM